MTTATTIPYKPTAPLRFPLILLAVISVLGLGRVLLGQHAVKKHGNEAVRIRKCLEKNGPIQEWQDVERDDICYLVVELEKKPCRKWAVMVAQLWPSIVDNCALRERTSFTPGRGKPSQVVKYLRRFAQPLD